MISLIFLSNLCVVRRNVTCLSLPQKQAKIIGYMYVYRVIVIDYKWMYYIIEKKAMYSLQLCTHSGTHTHTHLEVVVARH